YKLFGGFIMEEIENLIKFYNYMDNMKKNSDIMCVVFVFNSIDTYQNDVHKSECITSYEQSEIVNAFRSVSDYVISFNSEDKFIADIDNLKQKFKYVLVYSMAQNTNGIGRRCLVPLICEHYEVYNIGADFYSSVLGGNKSLMYEKIEDQLGVYFPITYIFKNEEDFRNIQDFYHNKKDFLLKPNSESASIGVVKIDVQETTYKEAIELIHSHYEMYGTLLIQQYIEGKEVEVPVIHHNNAYFAPEVVEIVFLNDEKYLDYQTIANENYDFDIYKGPHAKIIASVACRCAEILGFSAISRIDFRVNETDIYIIDITPNPTISSKSSAHLLFQHVFNGDEEAAYRLLVFEAIKKHRLLEPPLYASK
ncbi:ATP-grasp domain-containing protein, partial [Paenibacillus taichungensis]